MAKDLRKNNVPLWNDDPSRSASLPLLDAPTSSTHASAGTGPTPCKTISIALLCVGSLLGCSSPSDAPKAASGPASTASAAPEAEAEAVDVKELQRLEDEAREAILRKDWASARQLVRKGISRTNDNRDLDMFNARFLLLKGEIALNNSDPLTARRHFTDAMAIFHVHKNDTGRFETFISLGRLDERGGDYAAAERQLQEAEGLKEGVKRRSLLGEFLVAKGRLAARQMDHRTASQHYAEALQIFDGLKDNRRRAETLLLLAQEEDMLGKMGSSRQSLYRASKLFEEAGNPEGKVRAVHKLATYAEREKKYAVARRLFNEALELYEQLDQQTAVSSVRRHLSALPVPDKDSKEK